MSIQNLLGEILAQRWAVDVVYWLLLAWALFSTYYMIVILVSKNTDKVVPYIYDSIPTVFTTLGVLGTFLGIYIGLQEFDENDIASSVPKLLLGLKTAFATSILGIALSLVFGKLSQWILRFVETSQPLPPTDELSALQAITVVLQSNNDQNARILETLKTFFSEMSRSLDGIRGQISKANEDLELTTIQLNQSHELAVLHRNEVMEHGITLKAIESSIGGEDGGLRIQLAELNKEVAEYKNDFRQFTTKQGDQIESLRIALNENSMSVRKKFDEFSDLLKKNNTEALVEVMKSATEQFNAQMSALVERLVQENFKELNASVKNMIQWQSENKAMIGLLTEQFHSVSSDFKITSTAISDITKNTTVLVGENSSLARLIEELQKVMIEDTKYQELIEKITGSVDMMKSTSSTLKKTVSEFDDASQNLKTWIIQEKRFKDSVDMLLKRLEDYEKIKSYNEEFWAGTKKQMEDGVSIIASANKRLEKDIKDINEMFYRELNDTLTSLDSIMQQYLVNNGKR